MGLIEMGFDEMPDYIKNATKENVRTEPNMYPV